MATTSFFDRMKGAALLDVPVYEEVEADTTATGQAAAVVLIASVAGAIGRAGWGPSGIIMGLLMTLIGWVIWAAVTYFIGTRLFGGTATVQELLRTLGFAHAPGVLFVLGFMPFLGPLITFVVMVWMLVCGVIAIRQALDFDTGKAILTALIGWLVLLIPTIILGRMFSVVPAAGF
jgi:hypothetical protein